MSVKTAHKLFSLLWEHETQVDKTTCCLWEFTGFNVTEGKKSDVHVTVYCPLLCFTVWTAAVVYKPWQVSLLSGIYDPILWSKVEHWLAQENWADISSSTGDLMLLNYFRESEHVEVGHVVFMGPFDSLLALFCIYHLTHIFGDKLTLKDTNTHFIYVVSNTMNATFCKLYCITPPPHQGYWATAHFFQQWHIIHSCQYTPSWWADLPWGPNRGRLSWPLLSLHTVV